MPLHLLFVSILFPSSLRGALATKQSMIRLVALWIASLRSQ
jgi:hypothetical protein